MARPDVSEERRAQILAAATRVFVRDGLETARMDNIAHEAGLSVGGIYWYFKSKEAIVQSLLADMFDADLRGLRAALGQDGSVSERLSGYVSASLAQTAEHSPLSNELYSLATRNEAARAHLREYLSEFRRLLADLIRQGIERGEFRPVDPIQAALLLMSAYEGFTELAMLGVPESDAEGTLLAMLDLMLAGMRQAPAFMPAPALPSFGGGKWQTIVRP